MTDAVALVVSLVLAFAAAGIGSIATVPALREWYPSLPKPSWTPPNGIFGPVWTVLYAAMGVAAWLVWRARDERDVTLALSLYALQLVLNVVWSFAFFGARSPVFGMVAIVALWLGIAATAVAFGGIDALAGWLFVAYLAWVSFATALNAAILLARPPAA